MTRRTAEDTLAIQEVVAAYGHAIDDRDWDALSSLITDDVVIDYRNHDVEPPVGNGPYRGRGQILAALSGELMNAHPVQHILVSHLIQEVGDDEVMVRSKGLFPVGTDFRVANVGYRIGVRRTPDGWRIANLRTVAYPRPALARE
ncbi:MAG: nuclear transport factor 2 family protein [Trebonia sp.]|jgi:ketosteroid isomerase-like protein